MGDPCKNQAGCLRILYDRARGRERPAGDEAGAFSFQDSEAVVRIVSLEWG